MVGVVKIFAPGKAGNWVGINDMVELWKLVLSYYYSPKAKGSNSIKNILPAIIHDSLYIRNKYTKPIYGSEIIGSLNFKNHMWINNDRDLNPYNSLPSVLEGYQNDDLNQFITLVEDIADGLCLSPIFRRFLRSKFFQHKMLYLTDTKTKKPAISTICRLLVCFEIDSSGLYGTNLEPFSYGFEAFSEFVRYKCLKLIIKPYQVIGRAKFKRDFSRNMIYSIPVCKAKSNSFLHSCMRSHK